MRWGFLLSKQIRIIKKKKKRGEVFLVKQLTRDGLLSGFCCDLVVRCASVWSHLKPLNYLSGQLLLTRIKRKKDGP